MIPSIGNLWNAFLTATVLTLLVGLLLLATGAVLASGAAQAWRREPATGLDGDRMVMTMTHLDGVPMVSGRSVFSNITAAGFDYVWQTSTDGGQTWSDGNPVRFRKR